MSISELTTSTSAVTFRGQLEQLERERMVAVLNGLDENALYMHSLLEELEGVRSAYVGAAVTEIASLRAALGAPLLG